MPKDSLTVLATTAVPLSADQRKKITSAVAKANKNRTVMLDEKVDPDIIGGIRLTVGSLDYDATIASKLKKIKYQLQEKI